MKLKYISINLLLLQISFLAAQISGFVAAKAVLSIREKPDTKAKVIGKIPYGEKISYTYDEVTQSIATDGFRGDWVKTTYKGQTGYIVSTYVLPFPPPKDGTKTMQDYFKQITTPNGTKFSNKKVMKEIESEVGLSKQLFKNGMEFHQMDGYEYYSVMYFLPEFDTQSAYILIRLIDEFKDFASPTDPFYRNSQKVQKGEVTKEITVEKEDFGETDWIKKVRISYEDAGAYFLEINSLDGQVVVYTGAGV